MKIKHLLNSEAFKKVLENGKTAAGDITKVYAQTTKDQKVVTVGVIIAKKNVAKATTRNFIKRRIYAYFRETCFRELEKWKIVVRITKDLRKETLSRKELSETIKNDLERTVGKICSEKN